MSQGEKREPGAAWQEESAPLQSGQSPPPVKIAISEVASGLESAPLQPGQKPPPPKKEPQGGACWEEKLVGCPGRCDDDDRKEPQGVAWWEEKLVGLFWGTAVGDALGLPYEGLSRQRVERWQKGRALEHRFVWGRGMVSDDTEHACFVGQALLASRGEVQAFGRSLAWRLRGWLLGLPAGMGWATLRALLRLSLGFSPEKSGVWSAGNGPAMRSPLLGLVWGHDLTHLKALVRLSTRITHTDPRAEEGALTLALAVSLGARTEPAHRAPKAGDSLLTEATGTRTEPPHLQAEQILSQIRLHLQGEELLGHLATLEESLAQGLSCTEFAAALGLEKGVSGYINHTIPVVLYSWLRHKSDFPTILQEVIALGGDTDTVGALAGALAGATAGASAIPQNWLQQIIEWPRSLSWMQHLAQRLARMVVGLPLPPRARTETSSPDLPSDAERPSSEPTAVSSERSSDTERPSSEPAAVSSERSSDTERPSSEPAMASHNTPSSLAPGAGSLSLPSDTETTSPLPLFWPGLLLRNLFFLLLVLLHGFRRLLPPYG